MSDQQQPTLPNFRRALARLGPNRQAQAAALGLTERQLWTWVNRGLPRPLRRMPPELLRALADDKEQQNDE